MKKSIVASIAVLCLAVASCSGPGKVTNPEQRPLIYWEKNQLDLAHAENVWSGFGEIEGGLLATQQNPTLFFYLSSLPEEKRLTIVYSKKSEGRAALKVNEEEVLYLDPSPRFRQLRKKIEKLNVGLNFISINGPVEGLSIREIYFRKEKEPAGSLGEGESFRLALDPGHLGMGLVPGALKLTVKGRSSFRVKKTFFSQGLEIEGAEERLLRNRFPFYSQTLSVEIAKPLLLEIACTSGRLRLEEIECRPAAVPKKVEPQWPGKIPANVFIFLWDACQARHLGLYGYGRDTAPFLRGFASDAVVFRNAFANAAFTSASVTSLFTGLDPLHHGRVALDSKIDPALETLGSLFKSNGYTTALFTTNANVSALSGLAKGIDHYGRLFDVGLRNESHKVVQAWSDWLEKNPGGRRFSYVHFMEPHFPVIPPPPFLNQYKKRIVPREKTVMYTMNKKESFTAEEIQDVCDDYDSAINYVDSLFGSAIDYLKRKGLYNESLIILLSDHGEACYERGVWGHENNVFPETTHVPLVIKFPASCALRGDVREKVQITDIFPTLQQILGAAPVACDSPGLGEILLRPGAPAGVPPGGGRERPIHIMGFPNQGGHALNWGRWYYQADLNSFSEQLFDLENDPLPSLAGKNPEVLRFLRGRMLVWLREGQRMSRPALTFDLKSLSREEIDNLKSLGYL